MEAEREYRFARGWRQSRLIAGLEQRPQPSCALLLWKTAGVNQLCETLNERDWPAPNQYLQTKIRVDEVRLLKLLNLLKLSSRMRRRVGERLRKSAPQSSSMTAAFHAPGRRVSRGSIPTIRLAMCHYTDGNASSATWGCSWTAGPPMGPLSVGDRMTYSVATATGRSLGSTKPGSCGC